MSASPRQRELAARHAALVQQVQSQRRDLARATAPWARTIGWIERGLAAAGVLATLGRLCRIKPKVASWRERLKRD